MYSKLYAKAQKLLTIAKSKKKSVKFLNLSIDSNDKNIY